MMLGPVAREVDRISRFTLKAAATGIACVAIGATAGIVGASAAPSSKPAAPAAPSPWRGPDPGRGLRGGRGFGPRAAGGLGPAVHADVVVLNKAGTGYITATVDSGVVQSVSGDTLTIKEGVGNVTYKTVTLTIPAGATIVRNFSSAALSTLKRGDRVRVEQSSEGTDVFAVAPGAYPRSGGPDHRPGAWGPGGAGRPGVLPQSGGATAPAPPVPQTGA